MNTNLFCEVTNNFISLFIETLAKLNCIQYNKDIDIYSDNELLTNIQRLHHKYYLYTTIPKYLKDVLLVNSTPLNDKRFLKLLNIFAILNRYKAFIQFITPHERTLVFEKINSYFKDYNSPWRTQTFKLTKEIVCEFYNSTSINDIFTVENIIITANVKTF